MLPTASAIHPGNGVERSIGSGPGGWAAPGTSTTVRLTAFQKFLGQKTFQFTNVQLSDNSCDDRSVYADVNTSNGFIEEFVNSLGCGNSAYWAGPVKKTDVQANSFVWVNLYACGNPITSGCSTPVASATHYNPYTSGMGTITSTFSFCNKTGPGGATIACFYATLD
jgi:hypothetical protein